MIIQKPKAKKEKKKKFPWFFLSGKMVSESTCVLIFTQKDSNYN